MTDNISSIIEGLCVQKNYMFIWIVLNFLICSCEFKTVKCFIFVFILWAITIFWNTKIHAWGWTLLCPSKKKIHNLHRLLYKYRRAIQLLVYGGKTTRLHIHKTWVSNFLKKLSVRSYKIIPSLGAKEREEGIK